MCCCFCSRFCFCGSCISTNRTKQNLYQTVGYVPTGRAPSPEHVEVEQLLEQSNASPQRKALVDARRRLDQITHAKLQLQRTESSEAMHGTYVNAHRGDATVIAPANNSGCSPTTGAHQPHMPTRHAAYRHRYVVNTHFSAPSPPPAARDSASASARIRGRSRGRDSRGGGGSAGGGLTTEPIAPPLPRPPSRTSRVPLRPATLGFATNTAEAAGDAALHPTVARAMGRKEASVLMPGEDDTDTYSALCKYLHPPPPSSSSSANHSPVLFFCLCCNSPPHALPLCILLRVHPLARLPWDPALPFPASLLPCFPAHPL